MSNHAIAFGDCPIVYRGKKAMVVDTNAGYVYMAPNRRGTYLEVREIRARNSCATLAGSEDLPEADQALLAVMQHLMEREAR